MLSRYQKTLMALFQQLHALQAEPVARRLLALTIQETLLLRITRAERAIRKLRAANKAIKAQLAQRGTSKDAARDAKQAYQRGLQSIEHYVQWISVLRWIGDGIAFIYGDRWDLKQCALKEPAGFLSGKRGTRLGRKLLRATFAMCGTAVLNDLTHTLRHADLTLFFPDLWPEGGGMFTLIEAKSGRDGSYARQERQKATVEALSQFLLTDKRVLENGTRERMSCATERCITSMRPPGLQWTCRQAEACMQR